MSKTPPPFADLVPKAGHTTEEGRLNGTSKKESCWEFLCGSVEMNLTCIHDDTGSIPGLSQWVGDLVLL